MNWEFLWSLQSSVHRDLAWLIASPSLLRTTDNMSAISSEEYAQWFEASKMWMKAEDDLAFYLQEKVNTPRQYKLGLYAEDLMLHFFEAHPFYELLSHDLQIFHEKPNEKQCIGAMDFIVRSKSRGELEASPPEIEHWEMAIKYYLQLEPSDDWNDFIGPSGKDSMHRKLTKMLGKQLPLSLRAETHKRLTSLGIPVPTRRRILSKGIFFQQWNVAFQAPEGTDLHQPTGTWIRCKDFIEQFIFSVKRWKIRRHPRWIAPYITANEAELLNSEEVLAAPFERDRFLMLSEMTPCERGWQECHRWVLVVDSWGKIA